MAAQGNVVMLASDQTQVDIRNEREKCEFFASPGSCGRSLPALQTLPGALPQRLLTCRPSLASCMAARRPCSAGRK